MEKGKRAEENHVSSTSSSTVRMCVCVCVCVFVKESKRERWGGKGIYDMIEEHYQ